MNKKLFIVYNIILISLIIFTGVVLHKNEELKTTNTQLVVKSWETDKQLSQVKNEMNAYKTLYTSQEGDIKDYIVLYKKTKTELDNLKSQIYISKEKEKNASRGDYINKNLSDYAIMTVDEMNEWIAKRAPKGSPFIGKGEVFLKTGAANKIDPKLIVALAGNESGWGMSKLARDKGNYFSITAYNDNPYTSAKAFNGDFQTNISDGVAWIKSNFYDKGKTSLAQMQSENNKAYAQNNDGSPNKEWTSVICNIVYH